VLAFVSRVYLVEKPRYREPRWSTLLPPEAGEYWSPEMAALIRSRDTDLLQTEYTYLAEYGGDILVEHDVTFDLYAQVRERKPALGTWWDWWRWRRFETRAVDRFRRVIAMSLKDAGILSAANSRLGNKPAETNSTGEPGKKLSRIRIIENGVDTVHFQPEPEISGRHLLFIGSFRHFPNIVAYRFLTEQILPLLTIHDFDLTVVAGPEPLLHWRNRVGTLHWPTDPRIRIFEFVADVRPLYHRANLVLVPTLESAGTNIKVLEAMAMQRAVISTSSGVAGLGLQHGHNVWIADKPADFAAAIEKLLGDDTLRLRVAQAGRACVEQNFSWRAIGLRQREMYRELLGDRLTIRPVRPEDIRRIVEIQVASPQASRWDAQSYLTYDCRVAECEGRVVGFLVSRHIGPGEREIMNLAVDPTVRGQGIARRLVEHELSTARGQWFLEVRESNAAARRLYESLGFQAVGTREGYYHDPPEPGIVMTVFS
jgi:ribosomal-protein-alanine acetyltransferase